MTRGDLDDSDAAGQAWADILARRSPEGAAIVAELLRAEAAVLEIQGRIQTAIGERRDYADDFVAFEAALVEVDRMREEVYRTARQ